MALAPITLSGAEPIRLVSPYDPAIDTEATPEDVQRAYASGEDLDVEKLTLTGEPTWFTVHALSPREKRAVTALIPWSDAPLGSLTPTEEPLSTADVMARSAWVHETNAVYLRFGLDSIENLEGWDAMTQGRYLGLPCWDREAIAALHPESVLWLGSQIASLSALDPKKN